MNMISALEAQSRACAQLGSPFMGQLFATMAVNWPLDGPISALCDAWDGDVGPGGASLPLRLAGGLHALVLKNVDAGLARHYPPNSVSDDDLMIEVKRALRDHLGFFSDWMKSAPQTNEVRRSAVLVPAAHWLAARHDLPFMTSELGASAGLNLGWDRYGVEADQTLYGPAHPVLTLTPDWSGTPPRPQSLEVSDAQGVDLNPLDTNKAEDRLRLLAYLWPDQAFRADLTRKAIAARKAPVHKGDAVDWLEQRLSEQAPGQLHLIYHTIAWQYFPPERQDRGRVLIEAAGAKACADRPLAWLGLENDGGEKGAALTLRLWPGDHRIDLGRADFHGRWVSWNAGA